MYETRAVRKSLREVEALESGRGPQQLFVAGEMADGKLAGSHLAQKFARRAVAGVGGRVAACDAKVGSGVVGAALGAEMPARRAVAERLEQLGH